MNNGLSMEDFWWGAERTGKCILGYDENHIDKKLAATKALIMKGEIGSH